MVFIAVSSVCERWMQPCSVPMRKGAQQSLSRGWSTRITMRNRVKHLRQDPALIRRSFDPDETLQHCLTGQRQPTRGQYSRVSIPCNKLHSACVYDTLLNCQPSTSDEVNISRSGRSCYAGLPLIPGKDHRLQGSIEIVCTSQKCAWSM